MMMLLMENTEVRKRSQKFRVIIVFTEKSEV